MFSLKSGQKLNSENTISIENRIIATQTQLVAWIEVNFIQSNIYINFILLYFYDYFVNNTLKIL